MVFMMSAVRSRISMAMMVPSLVATIFIRLRTAFSYFEIFITSADMTPKILCRFFSACIFFNNVLCLW